MNSAKILVVDDQSDLRRITVRLLKKAGHLVLEAADADSAWQMIQTELPDLILLDVVLGDANGLEICRQIKADPAFELIYVILLSGKRASADDRSAGLEYGASDFIVRPVSNRELLARINAVLRIRSAEDKLYRERDLLHQITHTSPVGITVVDQDGKITFANHQSEKIFGLRSSEITQRQYNDPQWVITEYDGGPFATDRLPFVIIQKTLKPVYNARHAIQWPDGRRVLLRINGSPLFSRNKSFCGAVLTVEDVTDEVYTAQARHQQFSQEIESLAHLRPANQTRITGQSFGDNPLFEQNTEKSQNMMALYETLIEYALEERIYKVDHPISKNLRDLAVQLGQLRAGPRDIVDLHTRVLRNVAARQNMLKAKAAAEEGRLVVLELMGYLTAYYRDLSIGL